MMTPRRRTVTHRPLPHMSERLHKLLAQAGVGSRREVERWIADGRVVVDGHVASVGERVEAGCRVEVDGKPIVLAQRPANPRVIIYNKPEGEICTRSDPANRPTVFASLPRIRDARWVSVGRLDINTSGLLLFTDDGELANRLMHPRFEVEREYAVRVLGAVDDADIEHLRNGVPLDDGPARFDEVRDAGGDGANHWYRVRLSEGRKREVRRMWEAVGARVSRLIRVRYGPVTLPRNLRSGHWRELEPHRVTQLLQLVKLQPTGGGAAATARTGRPRARYPARRRKT
jgi:23S rRNA pseudouridine2605 synthase